MIRRSNNHGFTLLELIVGLTIISMIMLTIYAGLRLGARSWQAGTQRAEIVDEVRLLHGLLQRTLGSAVPIATRDNRTWQVWFEGTANSLRYLFAMPEQFGVAGYQELKIGAQAGESGNKLVSERRAMDEILNLGRQAAAVEHTVLVDELASISFAYFGSRDAKAPLAWHTSWERASRNPTMVKVRIASTGNGQWPDLLIPLFVDGVRYVKHGGPDSGQDSDL